MDILRCTHFGEPIGVYEPISVVLSEGEVLVGSRLTLRERLDESGAIAFHEACFRAGRSPALP